MAPPFRKEGSERIWSSIKLPGILKPTVLKPPSGVRNCRAFRMHASPGLSFHARQKVSGVSHGRLIFLIIFLDNVVMLWWIMYQYGRGSIQMVRHSRQPIELSPNGLLN